MSELTFKLVMLGENSSLISTINQSQTTAVAVFNKIKDEADKLRQSSEQTAEDVGKIIPNDLDQKASTATTAIGEVSHSTETLKQATAQTGDSVDQFGNQLSSVGKDAQFASSNLDQVSSALNSTGAQAQNVDQSIDSVGSAFDKLATQAQESEQSLTQVSQKTDELASSSDSASSKIANVIPRGTSELALKLTETLKAASTEINESGDNAKQTAQKFSDFGKVSEKALNQLKQDLETAKQKLKEFANTKTSPVDIELAKQKVEQLEQEVRQADQAFNGFRTTVNNANSQLTQTESASKQAQQAISGLKTGYTALASALAAVGIGLGAKQILETADSYTNLSARVKIAVGDTGSFEQAMSGVHQVALMTNSNLEATATLFTKVNDVGQKMGLTQQQNLDLVKTINMAIQTGGGSAQATEAALNQLTQALQSGVLRGDEFNSMAEQAPGLLKALSNGLAVSTAELRKMASEGQLSSSTVIQALQSQAKAVSDEYAKFPLTIGRALERIQTQWQITIGQMDQASDSSATVAQWLSAIADNMDVVDVLLQDIGNGFVWVGDQLQKIDPATIQAMKDALESAYETVKSFAGAFGTTFEAVSDRLNSVLGDFFNFSRGVDTAQDKTNGFTKLLQVLNVALGYVNDGFTGIGIGVNLFTAVIYDLNAAWLNLKSLFTAGSWKDEAIANMNAMSLKAQEYYEKASQGALEFKSKGEQAWNDISKTQKEKDVEAVISSKEKLDQLLADQQSEVTGKKVSEQAKIDAVKDYAEAAIKANNGVMDGTIQADLLTQGYIVTLNQAGQVSVETWEKIKDGADQVGLSAQDAALNAAKALGVDVPLALNQMSSAFKRSSEEMNVITSGFDALKNSGIDASSLVIASLEALLDKARSQKEIEYVRKLYVQFGQDGKISSDQVAAGLDNINQKLAKTPENLSEVQQAFKLLGLTMKQEANEGAQVLINAFDVMKQSGEATAGQVKQALIGMADKIYASGNTAKIAWYESQLAANNLQSTVNEVGKATVSAMEPLEQSMHRVRNATEGAKEGFRELGQVAREEAESSTEAWNKAMSKKAEDADKERSCGTRDGKSFTSYSLQDVIGKLTSMGYEQEDALKYANNIMLKAKQIDQAQVMNYRNSGNKANAEAYEALIAQGRTSIFGSNEIDRLLLNYSNRTAIGSTSSGSSSSTGNNQQSSINTQQTSSVSQQLNSSSVNTNQSVVRTVKFVFISGNRTVELTGSEDSEKNLETMLRELEILKKSS